ncbi:multidrug efflux SMR transporter [bacterium]|nr:MAG: multidrug efflux SMR transporter [bacterium]
MHYLFLALAICFEVAGTTCMKLSQGFTKPLPSVMLVLCYLTCFAFLTLALKKMDMSTTYAIWAGLGTALIAGVGVVVFHEPISTLKIGAVTLIIGGVAMLQLSGGH